MWLLCCTRQHISQRTICFGADTYLNAKTVNHWAKVTAETLLIPAITEFAEHTLRRGCDPHMHFCVWI